MFIVVKCVKRIDKISTYFSWKTLNSSPHKWDFVQRFKGWSGEEVSKIITLPVAFLNQCLKFKRNKKLRDFCVHGRIDKISLFPFIKYTARTYTKTTLNVSKLLVYTYFIMLHELLERIKGDANVRNINENDIKRMKSALRAQWEEL